MKFDMHCHTKEGSMDGKVPVAQFIAILKDKGFDGMLISDHNSYKGYRAWEKQKMIIDRAKTEEWEKEDADFAVREQGEFVVLKGIEYDTIDAGHILIIMPTGAKLRILELRGLPVQLLIDIVHKNGGILGPAHPCGEKYLSFTNTLKKRNQMAVMDKFDFLEGFNACESPESNQKAAELAEQFKKPAFGGSDAHKIACIGMAYTEFAGHIRNETDLIAYVKAHGRVTCGGAYYKGTTKERLGKINNLLVQSFWFYNRLGSLWRHHLRKKEMSKL